MYRKHKIVNTVVYKERGDVQGSVGYTEKSKNKSIHITANEAIIRNVFNIHHNIYTQQ